MQLLSLAAAPLRAGPLPLRCILASCESFDTATASGEAPYSTLWSVGTGIAYLSLWASFWEFMPLQVIRD